MNGLPNIFAKFFPSENNHVYSIRHVNVPENPWSCPPTWLYTPWQRTSEMLLAKNLSRNTLEQHRVMGTWLENKKIILMHWDSTVLHMSIYNHIIAVNITYTCITVVHHGMTDDNFLYDQFSPGRAWGVKSRMCPPYPQRDRKRRLNGAVCRNHRITGGPKGHCHSPENNERIKKLTWKWNKK